MAARPVWRGHLRLALVTCPVALHTVYRASGDLHFHFINPKTGHRVRMVTLDAETDEELARGELVRGYEFERDRYVILDDEDFERARIDSSSVLAIDKFVDVADIPPIYYDTSYYLAPDGDAGQDVYAVLREAIRQAGKAGLARVVIARRERAVAILPLGAGMVMHTLHEKRDVHDPRALFEPVVAETPDRDMVQLALQLVDRQTAPFEPADMEDRYEARLREVIAAKLRGEGIAEAAPEAPRRDNVVDLMAALKQSLARAAASADAPRRPSAKASRKAAPAASPKKAPAAKPRPTVPTARSPHKRAS
ncbi:MAG: Ku protein [Acetobacteraceae bacterium]|nr:Ku protein [Acetobacteraceae bacterium]